MVSDDSDPDFQPRQWRKTPSVVIPDIVLASDEAPMKWSMGEAIPEIEAERVEEKSKIARLRSLSQKRPKAEQTPQGLLEKASHIQQENLRKKKRLSRRQSTEILQQDDVPYTKENKITWRERHKTQHSLEDLSEDPIRSKVQELEESQRIDSLEDEPEIIFSESEDLFESACVLSDGVPPEHHRPASPRPYEGGLASPDVARNRQGGSFDDGLSRMFGDSKQSLFKMESTLRGQIDPDEVARLPLDVDFSSPPLQGFPAGQAPGLPLLQPSPAPCGVGLGEVRRSLRMCGVVVYRIIGAHGLTWHRSAASACCGEKRDKGIGMLHPFCTVEMHLDEMRRFRVANTTKKRQTSSPTFNHDGFLAVDVDVQFPFMVSGSLGSILSTDFKMSGVSEDMQYSGCPWAATARHDLVADDSGMSVTKDEELRKKEYLQRMAHVEACTKNGWPFLLFQIWSDSFKTSTLRQKSAPLTRLVSFGRVFMGELILTPNVSIHRRVPLYNELSSELNRGSLVPKGYLELAVKFVPLGGAMPLHFVRALPLGFQGTWIAKPTQHLRSMQYSDDVREDLKSRYPSTNELNPMQLYFHSRSPNLDFAYYMPREKCSVMLYKDSERSFEHAHWHSTGRGLFEDIYTSIHQALHFVYIAGWSVNVKIRLGIRADGKVNVLQDHEGRPGGQTSVKSVQVADMGGGCKGCLKPIGELGKVTNDESRHWQEVLTLGQLLRRKAEQGVEVMLIIWDDMTSSRVKKRGMMMTSDEETKAYFRNTGVHCALLRRKGLREGWIHGLWTRAVFTHHQKLVIVDEEFEGHGDQRNNSMLGKKKKSKTNRPELFTSLANNIPNKLKRRLEHSTPERPREITAYVGGMDLTDGRYDNEDHRLFHPYFHNRLTFYNNCLAGSNHMTGPRQPWHDIHSRIRGGAAADVLQNFIERVDQQCNIHFRSSIDATVNTLIQDQTLFVGGLPLGFRQSSSMLHKMNSMRPATRAAKKRSTTEELASLLPTVHEELLHDHSEEMTTAPTPLNDIIASVNCNPPPHLTAQYSTDILPNSLVESYTESLNNESPSREESEEELITVTTPGDYLQHREPYSETVKFKSTGSFRMPKLFRSGSSRDIVNPLDSKTYGPASAYKNDYATTVKKRKHEKLADAVKFRGYRRSPGLKEDRDISRSTKKLALSPRRCLVKLPLSASGIYMITITDGVRIIGNKSIATRLLRALVQDEHGPTCFPLEYRKVPDYRDHMNDPKEFQSYCAECFSHQTESANWNVQVFRSIDYASAKFHNEEYKSWFKSPKAHGVEQTIYWNYLFQINRAKSCIYVENQYFYGSSPYWSIPEHSRFKCNHLVPYAIARKVCDKIRCFEPFTTYIVLPLYSEGSPETVAIQEILFFQTETFRMMYKMIGDCISEVYGVSSPEKAVEATENLAMTRRRHRSPRMDSPHGRSLSPEVYGSNGPDEASIATTDRYSPEQKIKSIYEMESERSDDTVESSSDEEGMTEEMIRERRRNPKNDKNRRVFRKNVPFHRQNKAHHTPHPTDYLQVFYLGTREESPGPFKPELVQKSKLPNLYSHLKHLRHPIYVHSKLMIVDDEYITLGSANLNQRSLDGSRDTEINVGCYQPDYIAQLDITRPNQCDLVRRIDEIDHDGDRTPYLQAVDRETEDNLTPTESKDPNTGKRTLRRDIGTIRLDAIDDGTNENRIQDLIIEGNSHKYGIVDDLREGKGKRIENNLKKIIKNNIFMGKKNTPPAKDLSSMMQYELDIADKRGAFVTALKRSRVNLVLNGIKVNQHMLSVRRSVDSRAPYVKPFYGGSESLGLVPFSITPQLFSPKTRSEGRPLQRGLTSVEDKTLGNEVKELDTTIDANLSNLGVIKEDQAFPAEGDSPVSEPVAAGGGVSMVQAIPVHPSTQSVSEEGGAEQSKAQLAIQPLILNSNTYKVTLPRGGVHHFRMSLFREHFGRNGEFPDRHGSVGPPTSEDSSIYLNPGSLKTSRILRKYAKANLAAYIGEENIRLPYGHACLYPYRISRSGKLSVIPGFEYISDTNAKQCGVLSGLPLHDDVTC
eukprot:GHVH01009807.1.p1 GENE.GHVH01009807.1~~GHVH01009807.1.p1  ORF type:complete len:2048 (+),score=297.63 GHVH01009807.1:219-6362(+)